MVHRRLVVAGGVGLLGLGALARAAVPAPPAAMPNTHLLAAWAQASDHTRHQTGLLQVDWTAREVTLRWSVDLQSRAHGFAVDAHGLVVAAYRTGGWMLRLDPHGHALARARASTLDRPGMRPRFNGHCVSGVAHVGGEELVFATMTNDVDGQGCIGVFEARSLKAVDVWPSHGLEPHDIKCDAQGQLLVAHGGLRRDAQGNKLSGERVDSSLVRLSARTGELLGRWRLIDRALSMRHLAWSQGSLGVALQAEHDDPAARRAAPALAIWNGSTLATPVHDAQAFGFAGDIAASVDGGFVVSNHREGRSLRWHPDAPTVMSEIAQLKQAGALATAGVQGDGATLIAAARGLGRWHPTQAPMLVPWGHDWVLDNHWVALTL
jgi:uncharacterized protein